jgi:hypothetical protein
MTANDRLADIIVNLKLQAQGQKEAIREITSSVNRLKAKFADLRKAANLEFKQNGIMSPKTIKAVKTAQRGLLIQQGKLNAANKRLRGYQDTLTRAKIAQEKLGNAAKKGVLPFQGWALSIMFLGQMVLRMFQQIAMAGYKVFQDVMHSVEDTVTGFDLLEGSIKYLQFVIGDAIEPLAIMLLPLIESFTTWIEENEELARSFIKWGIIIGGVLAIVGSLVLGAVGLYTAFSKIGQALVAIYNNPALMLLLALGALTWKAFKETPAAWEGIKESAADIWESLKGFGSALDSFISNSTSFENTWDAIAWTMLWVVKVLGNGFGNLVDFMTSLINKITIASIELKTLQDVASGKGFFVDNAKKRAEIASLQSEIDAANFRVSQRELEKDALLSGPSAYKEYREKIIVVQAPRGQYPGESESDYLTSIIDTVNSYSTVAAK